MLLLVQVNKPSTYRRDDMSFTIKGKARDIKVQMELLKKIYKNNL